MTQTRILVGLVTLPAIMAIIYLGHWAIFGTIFLVAGIATWEFIQMMHHKGHAPNLILAWLGMSCAVLAAQFPQWPILQASLILLMIGGLILALFQSPVETPIIDWALAITGGFYIGLGLSHFISLRMLGAGWVWIALLATWGNDTLAYFGGRAFGKHKFWPRHSPKKTWEGIVAGIVGAIGGAGLMALLFGLSLWHATAVGILVAIVGPLGDISISLMKRYCGVKDSSNLIPGHGGMLDRVDSLLFTVVVAYYYIIWVAL